MNSLTKKQLLHRLVDGEVWQDENGNKVYFNGVGFVNGILIAYDNFEMHTFERVLHGKKFPFKIGDICMMRDKNNDWRVAVFSGIENNNFVDEYGNHETYITEYCRESLLTMYTDNIVIGFRELDEYDLSDVIINE